MQVWFLGDIFGLKTPNLYDPKYTVTIYCTIKDGGKFIIINIGY